MQRTRGMINAVVAMSTVGGAVTASHHLADLPRSSAQAVRYLAAAGVLLALSRLRARSGGAGSTAWRIVRPSGRQWWWLIAAAAAGQSGYNLAVVGAVDHADTALVASIISAVPLVLALAAPLISGRPASAAVLGSAVVVVAGAVLVQGAGRSDAIGVVLAVAALAGEAAFTLLALPVLRQLGAFSVATHTSWIAAVQLGILAAVLDGRAALVLPGMAAAVAIAYLVAASALAFVLWFDAVAEIGSELAGLATGVIPIAAVLTGIPLGIAHLDGRVAAGTALVAIGVTAGLLAARPTGRTAPTAIAPTATVPATSATGSSSTTAAAASSSGLRPDATATLTGSTP